MQRPTSVTVFGILNILFAVFGCIGTVASLALFMIPADAAGHNPMIELIQNSPGYALWLKVSVGLGIITCGALLAAGIGLLLLKPWAHKLTIGYAIYAIVFGIISSVVNFFLLVRPMLAEAQHQQGPEAAGAIGGAVGGMVGGCVSLIYPVLLLIFMLRPHVKVAFQPASYAPPR